MNKAMRKAMLVGVSVAFLCGSAAASAQGGGNGNGGSGGGNAHSAATAGMTHWGDPAPSPLDMPGGTMKTMGSMDGGMQPMTPDDATKTMKTGQ